jgi:hypothetical protein
MRTKHPQAPCIFRDRAFLPAVARPHRPAMTCCVALPLLLPSLALFPFSLVQAWARYAYPSLKPLASWVADYHQRIAFMRAWLSEGTPKCFWLPGFFFPQVRAVAGRVFIGGLVHCLFYL